MILGVKLQRSTRYSSISKTWRIAGTEHKLLYSPGTICAVAFHILCMHVYVAIIKVCKVTESTGWAGMSLDPITSQYRRLSYRLTWKTTCCLLSTFHVGIFTKWFFFLQQTRDRSSPSSPMLPMFTDWSPWPPPTPELAQNLKLAITPPAAHCTLGNCTAVCSAPNFSCVWFWFAVVLLYVLP